MNKMREEIQRLYQEEGFNPMSGCLPLLVQFPIIILLYNIVVDPLKYVCGPSQDSIRAAAEIVKTFKGEEVYEKVTANSTHTINLMAQIKDIMTEHGNVFRDIEGFGELTADSFPNLSYFGVNLGLNPGFMYMDDKIQYLLLLVPVLTFVVYFFSMKLNRKLSYQPQMDDAQMGCSNKMMDLMMPLFSVYITFITPAAIGIYWIFKSILGVFKQWILKKAMPIPEFSEEEYKAAVKELNSRQDKPAQKSGKVVRSLHHIDDEDFDDTREKALKHKEALAAQEAEEAAAKANAPTLSSLFGVAPKKKDDEKKEPKKVKAKKSKKNETAEEKPADEVSPEGKTNNEDN